MTAFDIEASVERAKTRLGRAPEGKRLGGKRRSDAGSMRIDQRVLACAGPAMAGQERPRMSEMIAGIAERCRRKRLAPPSRATVYKLMESLPGPTYRFDELPGPVRAALYNLGPGSEVPGRQVAFYCFNYGDLEATCFAAGLPWIAIYQALRLPGYRMKSRGLIEAVAVTRGITDGRA